jgi:hypothetical protein
MHCSLAHIEDLGKPRRRGPAAAFVNEKNIIIVHLGQCCVFVFFGFLEFLGRETRNCRLHSMLVTDLFCYLHGTCLKLGSLEPLPRDVSIDVHIHVQL